MSTDFAANDDLTAAAAPTIEQRERAARRAWKLTGLLVPLVFAGVLFGGLALSIYLHRRSLATPVIDEQQSANDGGGPLEGIKQDFGSETQPSSSPSEVDLESTLIELRRVSFSTKATHVRGAISRDMEATSVWKDLLPTTLDDDAGRRLAGSDALVTRFLTVCKVKQPDVARPTLNELKDLEETIDYWSDSTALQDATEEADRIQERARVWYAFEQNRIHALEQIRAEAHKLPATGFSLREALKKRDHELASARQLAAKEKADAEEARLEKQYSDLSDSLQLGNEEIPSLQKQLKRIESGASPDPEPNSTEPPIAASRSAYRRELPLIRATLKPFITPGYVQPQSADELAYGTSKLPMSYSALQRVGALKDSDEGLQILFRVGGSKSANQNNDRPLGSFPRMNSTSELQKLDVVTRLEEAQRLLRDYGLLMVEDGLLSP